MLLPPSEGKADGGGSRSGWDPTVGRFGRRLGDQRGEIVDALSSNRGGDTRLLGVSGRHLDRAQIANSTLRGAPTLPAWRRYTGVVWDHLDPGSLSADARRRIVVVSGLLGLVRGDDPTPDYRLKMGASLAPMGKLSTWWRDDLTAALADLVRRPVGGRPVVLVDLLPQEHRAAIHVGQGLPTVVVDLVDPSGKPGGHAAKAAKGELAAALLTDGLGALDEWHHARFDAIATWPETAAR
ncbi:MAG: peroxide stress protein YaaA [Actinomycetota bacterium]